MAKRYTVHSPIDIGAHWVEDEFGCYVLASDYDDLRAQCGGMEMTIGELNDDLAGARQINRLQAEALADARELDSAI